MTKETEKRKKKKKKRKKGAEPAAGGAPLRLTHVPPPAPLLDDPLLQAGQQHLAQARARWEHGDWAALLQMDEGDLAGDADRAKIALILAAAHSHAGDMARAGELARKSVLWGAERTIVARVLLSAAQNSLARVSAALEEDPMPHFEAAIRLVQPHVDVPLLARSRRVRELAHMGLLPEAAAVLENELHLVRQDRNTSDDAIKILESKLQFLKHELALSLARSQLHVNMRQPSGDGKLSAEQLKSLSVSQLGQDLWVLEKSNYKRGGFFVEFGATDGILLSNTYLLEVHFGWRGLCAEPNPGYFADLKRNRNCIVSDACIGPVTGQEVEFVLADEFGTMGQYSETDMHSARRAAFRNDGRAIRLRTTSLEDFLIANDAPRQIDYLSVDTEGSEFDILSAFPFDAWNIRLISVEHNFTPMREKIRHLLESHDYHRTEAQWDDWYALPDP